MNNQETFTHPLIYLLLIGIFICITSCQKNSHSNYNPYSIAEVEETENGFNAEEIEQIHAQQIIEGTSVLPELVKISMQAVANFIEQDSLQGNVATVRTGCPCVDYVADAASGGGVLTLDFDDGTGNGNCTTPGVGSLPKTYSGTVVFTFDGPISIENNTFSMAPLTDFQIEDYTITTSSDWDFTWEPLPRYFYGGLQSPLVVTNNTDNNTTTYEMNPNEIGSEVMLIRITGQPLPTTPADMVNNHYELLSWNFTAFCPTPIKATCLSSTTGLSEEYLLGIGDRISAGRNGNNYPTSVGDIDPIVVNPADCGCYVNGSMWVAPFESTPTFTEYNWGYNANENSVSNQCDEYYLRRAFDNDPDQTLLTSSICSQ